MMNNKHEIVEKIAGLRVLMHQQQIDAYLITGTDPHLSEYTPEEWKTREWITGFTGSYGKVLVTKDKAMLWTDTRYFIQATEELDGTGISLMKERIPGAVSVEDWIIANMQDGNEVAVDGLTISGIEAQQIKSKLAAKDISFTLDKDLVCQIWTMRPLSVNRMLYEHPIRFAGKSRPEKFAMVRKMLVSSESDATVISMLDDLAWVFNLRGNEILYTPLFQGYGYINQQDVWLFVDSDRLSAAERDKLENEGIRIQPYPTFLTFLSRIENQKIAIDPIRTNSSIIHQISGANLLVPTASFISQIKAVKDQLEIRRIKTAHIKDGAAMVHALYHISQSFRKEKLTEIKVGDLLNEYRSHQPLFMGDSFHPIVGFGPHGAIVHYHATEQSNSNIEDNNILLIDSGGQYLDGTTDITRTIGLGSVAKKHKEDFTTCLKGHIALAKAVFPVGTKGYSLDAFARKALWDRGINYGHGTGHGIGYFLSVHEGPMSIRTEFNNEPIREGHLMSNEPGIYREGEYGIRIENVILCKKYKSTVFGEFLCFETISLCPIDRKLILITLLTKDEISWVNAYHRNVLKKISPLIKDKVILKWLARQCAPLK
ncbi:MAG: aminopeptidase P family protein [Prolixibacteraceae bacterium]